jgi:hypothetical protein
VFPTLDLSPEKTNHGLLGQQSLLGLEVKHRGAYLVALTKRGDETNTQWMLLFNRIFLALLLACFMSGALSACEGFKGTAKSFPECDRYAISVCESCGPEGADCRAVKHKMERCKDAGKCVEQICIDSLESLKTMAPADQRKLLCPSAAP